LIALLSVVIAAASVYLPGRPARRRLAARLARRT